MCVRACVRACVCNPPTNTPPPPRPSPPPRLPHTTSPQLATVRDERYGTREAAEFLQLFEFRISSTPPPASQLAAGRARPRGQGKKLRGRAASGREGDDRKESVNRKESTDSLRESPQVQYLQHARETTGRGGKARWRGPAQLARPCARPQAGRRVCARARRAVAGDAGAATVDVRRSHVAH